MPQQPLTSLATPPLDPPAARPARNALRRRITVERIATAGGRAGSVHVDRIEVGEASIDSVTIEDLAAHLQCGAALLRNVRAILELHFEVRWSYDLKWLGSDNGVKTLGSKEKPIPLHDIRIPMLRDIAFDIPSAEVSDVSATVLPVTNVALGGASFEGLAIDDTRLPSDGFQLSGMDFASLEIEILRAPAADSRQLTIARFAPDEPLRLPDIGLGAIQLPEVDVPDVASPEPVTLMDIQPETFEAPVFKIGDHLQGRLRRHAGPASADRRAGPDRAQRVCLDRCGADRGGQHAGLGRGRSARRPDARSAMCRQDHRLAQGQRPVKGRPHHA